MFTIKKMCRDFGGADYVVPLSSHQVTTYEEAEKYVTEKSANFGSYDWNHYYFVIINSEDRIIFDNKKLFSRSQEYYGNYKGN